MKNTAKNYAKSYRMDIVFYLLIFFITIGILDYNLIIFMGKEKLQNIITIHVIFCNGIILIYINETIYYENCIVVIYRFFDFFIKNVISLKNQLLKNFISIDIVYI